MLMVLKIIKEVKIIMTILKSRPQWLYITICFVYDSLILTKIKKQKTFKIDFCWISGNVTVPLLYHFRPSSLTLKCNK